MLLLSSPRSGRLRRASLLLLAAVLLCVGPVSSSLPVGSKCHHIDCAKEGRRFCRPGSSQCGPCLPQLKENEEGLCVVKKRPPQHAKVIFYTNPEEEIDFLQSIVEKEEVTETRPPKKQSQHLAAVADVKKSRTDASKQKQSSQDDHSAQSSNPTTKAASAHTPTPQPRATGVLGRVGPIAVPPSKNDNVIVIIISLCVLVGAVAVILATVCFVKLQKDMRLAQKVDYPAFGGAGVPAAVANGTSMGDKNLAKSAQMYHYQHQKQQMLSMGNSKPEQKVPEPEVTSDEEEVGGDFTVYECPGLAPTGEMEVKNPLFDDSTLNYQGNHK